jgi:hypothetical protein
MRADAHRPGEARRLGSVLLADKSGGDGAKNVKAASYISW